MRPEQELTPEPTPEQRFALRLEDVLHEAANPEPGRSLEARIRLALEQERQRGTTMHTAHTYPVSSVPGASILWGGQPVQSGMGLRGLFGATAAHAALILLIVFAVAHRVGLVTPARVETATMLTAPPAVPRTLPHAVAAGGGGGQRGPTPVTRGTLPRFAARQTNPPQAAPLAQPRIAVPVTLDVQPDLKMANSDVPQISMPNSPLVGLSMGNGRGTGLGAGAGAGAGLGTGSGGNTGGGVKRIGGGVSAPVVLFRPEPEFSDEARKAKTAGNVLVYLQVDEQGRPQHVRVVRGIGMGLDQKAVAAVERYRFRPAMEDGHPVRVEMQVDVDFQIY